MNDAIATTGSNALVLDSLEDSLLREVSKIEADALRIVVKSDDDYARAGEVIRAIKQMNKHVSDYWEPVRKTAHENYNAILAKKKAMLAPVESAEKILKGKMAAYADRKEQERRDRERALQELARKEMEKKLAEAAKAEAEGDPLGAEFAMAEAEVMEAASKNSVGTTAAPKVSGVSTRKSWVITKVDLEKVPTEIAGAVIRPVDEKAVMQLIKATKGSIKIPGIEYKETVDIAVRA